jgi:hypothetical protein
MNLPPKTEFILRQPHWIGSPPSAASFSQK